MKHIIKSTIFWLKNARLYSSPITILSWLVIFIYSLKQGGNAVLGLISLIGICLVHLATNLADDYFDYKVIVENDEFRNTIKSFKCAYLKSGEATIKDLKNAIIIFLAIAGITGIILFFLSGPAVAWLALIALFIALSYSKFSSNGLGEIAVFIAYGPLMFEGVYYVMTKTFSLEVLILSVASVMLVISLLYTHMLMDFDGDKCANKKTLCIKLKTKDNALKFLLIFYLVSYIIMGYLAVSTGNYLYLITYITIPLVIDLYKSLALYNQDKTNLPTIHFWHYPLDNWKEQVKTPNAPFYLRFLMARNIANLFLLLTCLAIYLEK